MGAQLCADSGGDGDARLALSVLHDLLGVAGFLASHPLHAAYLLFFSRHLLSLACFFCPLLVTTSLLLAVLVTVAPRVGGGGEWSLGRTCGIAVGALRAGLRPYGSGSGSGAVALVGQLCSFVLGPGDVSAVLRVGEIMGELCDIGDSCLILQDKCVLLDHNTELAAGLPWQGAIDGKISMDQENVEEFKDGIEEKNVVLEDLKEQKAPSFSSVSETALQEMEDQEQNAIQVQSLGLSDVDGLSDSVEEKRLECDPVSVEIKKREPVKSLSSVSRRILQWEAQVSGNFMRVLDEMEDNSVEFCLEKESFRDVKQCDKFGAGAYALKCGEKRQVKEIDSGAESGKQKEEHEFKDVKECVQAQAETCTEKCSKEQQSEECADIAQSEEQLQEESLRDVQPQGELQDLEYKDFEPVKELQDQEYKSLQPEEQEEVGYTDVQHEKQQLQEQNYNVVQTEQELQQQQQQECRASVENEQELQDQEEFKDANQEPAREEGPLKSTSIARRMHSRTSSENLVGEGSPRKEKEWKRTLACKLYEERMQLKLCRDRAVVECSDNMDMLWEAYEVGGGGGGGGDPKRGGSKAKRDGKQAQSVVDSRPEAEAEEGDDADDDDDEGSVRQLCCLQALKFSTRKMNFGGGKPSLAKISKVLKRMAALSRSASRRSIKG